MASPLRPPAPARGLPPETFDACGCCGATLDATSVYWCGRCLGHISLDAGPPWERTYFAQTGNPCPYQLGP